MRGSNGRRIYGIFRRKEKKKLIEEVDIVSDGGRMDICLVDDIHHNPKIINIQRKC